MSEESGKIPQSVKDSVAKVEEMLASVTSEDGILQIGGKNVDLKDAFPLVFGDFRKLGKLGLIDKDSNVKAADPDAIAKLLLHLVNKVDPQISEDQLDSVPLTKISRLFLFVRKTLTGGEYELHPTKSGS